MLVMSSRVDAHAYQEHSVFRYSGWPSSICLEET